MIYRLATVDDAKTVTDVVQITKGKIYPNYYPKEVVDFFANLHCYDHVLRDIRKGLVSVLEVDGTIVGTGSYEENHITRVYVLPQYQGYGYGSEIVKQLEEAITKDYEEITLDASLPACKFYEKKGYHTVKHEEWECEHGAKLVYDIMSKRMEI